MSLFSLLSVSASGMSAQRARAEVRRFTWVRVRGEWAALYGVVPA